MKSKQIQDAMRDDIRHQHGAHYTPSAAVRNIMNQLLFNDLRAYCSTASKDDIIKRISLIKIFDPACGCGNFLTESLVMMRELESKLNINAFSESQLYGIEYMPDVADEFRQLLPGANIINANALRVNWSDFISADNNTYICGNPPFLGSGNRSDEQDEDQRLVMSKHIKSFKSLDYVCNWFVLCAKMIHTTGCRAALISTNSVSQGSHVPALWPFILKIGVEIGFAFRSFKWQSDASKAAAVSCVAIGLRQVCDEPKRLFNGEEIWK